MQQPKNPQTTYREAFAELSAMCLPTFDEIERLRKENINEREKIKRQLLKEIKRLQPPTVDIPSVPYDMGFLDGVLAYARAIRKWGDDLDD